ncbi:MAG: pyruvate dehydrogenase complex dihydrolipoamide acetyltransferase [Phycisphaerae bacterium]|nr:pyruvate dehydrogenase complex dihydrolipoamide acetyltransferase [Phycisphaerae bacterium]
MQILRIPALGKVDGDTFVVSVAVEPGGAVEKGQVLAAMQTADQVVQIASPTDGTVAEVSIFPGKMVCSGEPLLSLGAPPSAPQLNSTQAQSRQNNSNMTEQSAHTASGQVTPILMPQAGQSMEEGTLLTWKIKEGDRIEVGQVICEIETDKATMEVEATHAGRVAKIVAQEGTIVEVKHPIAFLADNDADVATFMAGQARSAASTSAPSEKTDAPAAASASVAQPAVISTGGRVKASPAARKIAHEQGIDLAAIAAGSGPGGRIISHDIKTATAAATAPSGKGVRHDLSKMRRAIAQNLLWSKQNVPHFYTKITIDATPLLGLYRKTKEQFTCSLNDFVTRACAIVVAEIPAFRSQYKDDHIMEQPSAHIGIAVGTENGLTVPVVLNADRLSLRDLATQSRQVVESARNGKLEGIGQGVFTVTNLGMFGVEEFSAIINPPESAILAVGAIREDVIVKDGVMRPGRVMTMVLSADHRVIDGTVAGAFAARIKALLEQPEQLL